MPLEAHHRAGHTHPHQVPQPTSNSRLGVEPVALASALPEALTGQALQTDVGKTWSLGHCRLLHKAVSASPRDRAIA